MKAFVLELEKQIGGNGAVESQKSQIGEKLEIGKVGRDIVDRRRKGEVFPFQGEWTRRGTRGQDPSLLVQDPGYNGRKAQRLAHPVEGRKPCGVVGGSFQQTARNLEDGISEGALSPFVQIPDPHENEDLKNQGE
jgi:hypothetical protein